MWPGSPEEAILDSACALRAQDKGTAPAVGTVPPGVGTLRPLLSPPVPYEIFRADHSCLVSVLPVNASVRDVLRALAPRLGQDREHVLVKVNSAGGEGAPPGWPCPRAQPGSVPSSIPAPRSLPADRAVLPPDAVGVFTALGLNERLFVVSRDELGSLVSAGWGSGVGSTGQTHPEGLGVAVPRFGVSVPLGVC